MTRAQSKPKLDKTAKPGVKTEWAQWVLNKHVPRYMVLGWTAGVAVFVLGVVCGVTLERVRRAQADMNVAAKPSVHNVGEVVKSGWMRVSAASVKQDEVGGNTLKPRSGNMFLIIELRLKNVSAVTLPVAPYEQTYVTDDANHVHNLTPAEVSNPLRAGNLAAGDALTGEVVYEVPVGTKQAVFHMDTGWQGQLPVLIDVSGN